MTRRGYGDHRIWESNTDPGTLRYVVRYVVSLQTAFEVGYKRKSEAFKKAGELTAQGHYVEVFDTDRDYGW